MDEQTMTTKQTYQAYLRGEVPIERVEESARKTLAKYKRFVEPRPGSGSRTD